MYSCAKWMLKVPPGSVDVERSFSTYHTILADDRQSMNEETIIQTNFLSFNQPELDNNNDNSLNSSQN